NPVARVESWLDRIDSACVGARPALPAAVNVLAAGQRRNFRFQVFVVVRDDPRLDERRPVARDVHPIDDEILVGFQVLRADEGFFVNGHYPTPPSASDRKDEKSWRS